MGAAISAFILSDSSYCRSRRPNGGISALDRAGGEGRDMHSAPYEGVCIDNKGVICDERDKSVSTADRFHMRRRGTAGAWGRPPVSSSNRSPRGNRAMRGLMDQIDWGAVRTKGCFFNESCHRLVQLAVLFQQGGADRAAGGFHGHRQRHLFPVPHHGDAESLLGLQAAQDARNLGAGGDRKSVV